MLVGSIVGCHHGHRLLCWLLQHHRLLCWLLHHLHVRRELLADEVHHGELRWHGHGCPYSAGLRHPLYRVVRHRWELLWALLLLGATGGRRSTAACQGKDGLVHSGDRSAHDVCPRRVRVVSGSSIPARHARVGVVDVATVGATVVPILPTLVGRGRVVGCCAPVPLPPNQVGCCGKLPVPFAPPEPPLRLLLLRRLLCCCC